jgi:hypothetical protein
MALHRLRIARAPRIGGAALIVLFGLFGAAPARGAPSGAEAECKAAYTHAQEREQAGSLREARDLLVACTKPSCSKALRQQCEVQYNTLESRIPTIVLSFTDKNGSPRADVQVQMDGQPLVSQLDGQPVAVDPGVHEFAFKTADGQTSTKKLMIVESDRGRTIDGGLAAPAPTEAPAQAPAPPNAPAGNASPPSGAPKEAPPPPPPPPVPEEPEPPLPPGPRALPFALGGVGIVAVGAGAGLAIKQKTLGIGLDCIGAGLGAVIGAVWLLARPRPPEQRAAPHAAYTVDVHPAVGGGTASVSGRF